MDGVATLHKIWPILFGIKMILKMVIVCPSHRCLGI